jgi:hypothetical protein
MIVEAKRELDRMKDVDEHLKRIQLIRQTKLKENNFWKRWLADLLARI